MNMLMEEKLKVQLNLGPKFGGSMTLFLDSLSLKALR